MMMFATYATEYIVLLINSHANRERERDTVWKRERESKMRWLKINLPKLIRGQRVPEAHPAHKIATYCCWRRHTQKREAVTK